jgi:hypothetical protein
MEMGSRLHRRSIGVQGAWRREGRPAGDVRVIGERVRPVIKSRGCGCGDLDGKHLEKRTGGALDWRCIVAPAADHTIPPSLSTPTVPTARFFRGPGLEIPACIDPHCQQPIPSALPPATLDPLCTPTSGRRMRRSAVGDARRQRCPPSSVHLSSAGSLLHLSCLFAHGTRQAAYDAGRAPCPSHRSASCAGDLAFGPGTSPCAHHARAGRAHIRTSSRL